MPGKQMSIDADLNAGLINETEARRRRREIAEEADFYGSMDGASKFVRGDATAAIIIVFVNIIGGLTIGVLQQGMSPGLAAQTYTLLTVGEGLVAQIPALFISTAAGIVVTRAAADADLGLQITRQMLLSPKAVGTAAGILLALGLVPGLPHLAFLGLGASAAWLAYRLAQEAKAPVEPAPVSAAPKVEATPQLAPLDLMEVQVGYGLIGLVEGKHGTALLDRIKGLRKQFADSMGFLLPPIHIRDNLQLRPNEYAVMLKGVELTKADVLPSHVLAIDPEPLNGASFMVWRRKSRRLDCPPCGCRRPRASKRNWPAIPWWMPVRPSRRICRKSSNVMVMNCWGGRRCRRCSTRWQRFIPNWLRN